MRNSKQWRGSWPSRTKTWWRLASGIAGQAPSSHGNTQTVDSAID